MINGDVPFKASHDYQTFQLILNRKLTFPEFMSEEAKDLIDKLLNVDPDLRLGSGSYESENDINMIRKHPFF